MFESNGIELTEEQIKQLFDMVDKHKSGKLQLQQFKALVQSEEAQSLFRKMIQTIREKKKEKGNT